MRWGGGKGEKGREERRSKGRRREKGAGIGEGSKSQYEV
jgi:hypothetical protein